MPYSVNHVRNVPKVSKIPVDKRTKRACVLNFLKAMRNTFVLDLKYSLTILVTSNQTIKPTPPAIIKLAMVKFKTTLVTSPCKLILPKLSKPALQKAETAIKTELKIPLNQP